MTICLCREMISRLPGVMLSRPGGLNSDNALFRPIILFKLLEAPNFVRLGKERVARVVSGPPDPRRPRWWEILPCFEGNNKSFFFFSLHYNQSQSNKKTVGGVDSIHSRSAASKVEVSRHLWHCELVSSVLLDHLGFCNDQTTTNKDRRRWG